MIRTGLSPGWNWNCDLYWQDLKPCSRNCKFDFFKEKFRFYSLPVELKFYLCALRMLRRVTRNFHELSVPVARYTRAPRQLSWKLSLQCVCCGYSLCFLSVSAELWSLWTYVSSGCQFSCGHCGHMSLRCISSAVGTVGICLFGVSVQLWALWAYVSYVCQLSCGHCGQMSLRCVSSAVGTVGICLFSVSVQLWALWAYVTSVCQLSCEHCGRMSLQCVSSAVSTMGICLLCVSAELWALWAYVSSVCQFSCEHCGHMSLMCVSWAVGTVGICLFGVSFQLWALWAYSLQCVRWAVGTVGIACVSSVCQFSCEHCGHMSLRCVSSTVGTVGICLFGVSVQLWAQWAYVQITVFLPTPGFNGEPNNCILTYSRSKHKNVQTNAYLF